MTTIVESGVLSNAHSMHLLVWWIPSTNSDLMTSLCNSARHHLPAHMICFITLGLCLVCLQLAAMGIMAGSYIGFGFSFCAAATGIVSQSMCSPAQYLAALTKLCSSIVHRTVI